MARSRARVGLIVNPIAGMGGRVGLKGTDGPAILRRARALGAMPVAPSRAERLHAGIAGAASRAGLDVDVQVVTPRSAAGTRRAATAFRDAQMDLLVFVGGDGTARDVCAAVGATIPVLGVPSGVKMHSAVFTTGPASAADALVAWLQSPVRSARDAEVVDIDEAAVREGRMEVRLYGTLRVPDLPGRIQALKASGARAEAAEMAALAAEVVRRLPRGAVVLLGPGTTTRAVSDALAVPKTLLGIDAVELADDGHARVIAADAGESALLAAVEGRNAVAVISPTGGQGFLLGRGNQQLSPAVLSRIGVSNVLVVAAPSKLAGLGVRPLYVDTGDAGVDASFAGHRRVITGPGRETLVRVQAG
jgi:predicted polyphosphate/ATP-dependent NAD kinase